MVISAKVAKGIMQKKLLHKKNPQFLIQHSVENLQVAGNKANPQHIKNYRLANEFQIVTPIKPDIFKQYLVGYDPHKTEFWIGGFKYGFKIPFEGEHKFDFNKNLKSAIENSQILKEKINKELVAGRVEGSFARPPFENFRVSPPGVVPKAKAGEYRIIHHLSSPHGSSIHDSIRPDCKSVRYQSIDLACQLILKFGRKCMLSKINVEHAYKLVPVHSSDFHLLGFTFDDGYYFDKTLPMGLSHSCSLFTSFSNAIHWIAENKLGIHGCIHVLDDFLFIVPPPKQLDKFTIFLEYVRKHRFTNKGR